MYHIREKCFEDMTNDELLNYVSEHNGSVQKGHGINSDGHEFRCDSCGVALILKENTNEQ